MTANVAAMASRWQCVWGELIKKQTSSKDLPPAPEADVLPRVSSGNKSNNQPKHSNGSCACVQTGSFRGRGAFYFKTEIEESSLTQIANANNHT